MQNNIMKNNNKKVIYQVFTRLFGNTNTTNKPWGTLEENGVGKFDDFTDKALAEIKALGVTHIWYTGVPHHALVGDYADFGISHDHPAVVKGRAGSPYAVKDYFNVNPDLANDPANRLNEFKALVDRSHKAGLKVIIDIVPNHVARCYQGLNNPAGVVDFGADDDTSLAYHRDNNFYYLPDEALALPDFADTFEPLGGEEHPMLSQPYQEFPAKWTGNGAQKAKPDFDDWYETVKVNYGVRPDGSKDFDSLPEAYMQLNHEQHYRFWQGKSVPDSWKKFRQIAEYWLMLGVDGFRYDMAEMVPVEFWSYLNSAIKYIDPDAFLLAEVYQPDLYRQYVHLGKMDALYDKVDFYDALKLVMQGKASTDELVAIRRELADIEPNMLQFLENHDEQRLASPQFAGNAELGKPAMLLSACIGTAPAMVYFGQEVGEVAEGDMGFGRQSRTSIFDYCGVPAHQRWMNNGAFDGGQLSEQERELRDFYQRLLTFTVSAPALDGDCFQLHEENRAAANGYDGTMFAFARSSDDAAQKLILFSHFSDNDKGELSLKIPANVIEKWHLSDGAYPLKECLYGQQSSVLFVENSEGWMSLSAKPLAALVFEVSPQSEDD